MPDSESSASLVASGVSHLTASRTNLALVDFERALKLDPDNVDALFKRSILHRHNGDFDRAAADFDTAIQILWRRRDYLLPGRAETRRGNKVLQSQGDDPDAVEG